MWLYQRPCSVFFLWFYLPWWFRWPLSNSLRHPQQLHVWIHNAFPPFSCFDKFYIQGSLSIGKVISVHPVLTHIVINSLGGCLHSWPHTAWCHHHNVSNPRCSFNSSCEWTSGERSQAANVGHPSIKGHNDWFSGKAHEKTFYSMSRPYVPSNNNVFILYGAIAFPALHHLGFGSVNHDLYTPQNWCSEMW